MPTMLILTSFLHVAIGTAIMVLIVWQGIYRPIKVDLGEYGERPDSAIGPYRLPEWLPLERPLNALVNAGYVIVSIVWMARTYLSQRAGLVGPLHAYFAYTFGWMGVAYGPIQFVRIVWQTHESAILDQWVTLPFFTWAILWCKSLTTGWDLKATSLFLLSSVLSYNLVFFNEYGFEIALILHLANTLSAGLSVHAKHRCRGNGMAVCMVCVTLSAFVVFKLLDVHLPRYSSFFSEVSGHFLSKLLGDVALMHFAFVFFENIAKHLQADRLAERKEIRTMKKK